MNTFDKLLLIFGGFISYALADGYTYSMGILYSYFLDTFQASSAATAALPGLVYAMPQILALFLCPLLENYGYSSGSAWGALLLFLGCLSKF